MERESGAPWSQQKSHHFRSVIGGLHSVFFRFVGLEVPIFRDLPSTAVSRASLINHRNARVHLVRELLYGHDLDASVDDAEAMKMVILAQTL
jgi:hypothetical protein